MDCRRFKYSISLKNHPLPSLKDKVETWRCAVSRIQFSRIIPFHIVFVLLFFFVSYTAAGGRIPVIPEP